MFTTMESLAQYTDVINKFESARRKASLRKLIERLLGRYESLADFNNLSSIQSKGRLYRGMCVVPVERITGSVNRRNDYDRWFRPLHKHLRERWVNSYLRLQCESWEPVRLYKVWNSYYVADGQHCVSAALSAGVQYIEAEVWEYGVGKTACQHVPVHIPVQMASLPAVREECAVSM